jgi:adenylyl cyclase-associated protein
VNKEQQTWRKEYKKDDTNNKVVLPQVPTLDATTATTSTTAPVVVVKKKKPLLGVPIFEYQDRGFKWVIENHTRESVLSQEASSTDGILNVDISDPKQQVYLYNCDGITVRIHGKFKSLVLDKCVQCAVVYDTLISSAELVNCKKIQLQVNGVCPVFTIDKTVNVLIWLSPESVAVSSFTTSLSSEMNVSFPDGEDQKEVPIPEQYVHKLTSHGTLSSVVSDLYN